MKMCRELSVAGEFLHLHPGEGYRPGSRKTGFVRETYIGERKVFLAALNEAEGMSMRNACGAYGMCTGVLGGVPSNKMRLYDKGVSCHPFGM